MKIKAQCLSIQNNSGISSKTGKNYSINEMYILDTEAPRPEVLKLNVHENDLADARAMIGKTVVLDLFFNVGGFRFGGQVHNAAVVAKAA